ncbi:MAG: hypothetical protein IJO60_05385 [Agathobacter sp.]|nr:hypothetical protein [Agathobacter sp.]
MVVAYLEKIKDGFIEEKVDIQSKLTDALIIKKENIEFIKLLEQNNDSNFEVFTPRTVNSFHKKKIEELKEEQKNIENFINELKVKLENIDKEIEEVSLVISIAKEKLC